MGRIKAGARLAAVALLFATTQVSNAFATPSSTLEPKADSISQVVNTEPTSNIFSPTGKPEIFCSNPLSDYPGPFTSIDLVNKGCVSGISSSYENTGDGPDDWDGFYENPGDFEDAVETQILIATGRWVEMTLAVKLEMDQVPDSGRFVNEDYDIDFEYWLEDAGKQILWRLGDNATQFDYLTIKGANSYVLWDIRNNEFAGRYSTEGLFGKGGQQPGISHVVFWKADPVPAPAALLLFGLGAGAIALGHRRRKS